MAERLTRIAESLINTAHRIDMAPVRIKTINIRHGWGAHKAVTEVLTPYAQDAEIKATKAGAPLSTK